MQIHSLDFDDVYEDDYTLIGIHTALEDYKLAYHLNRSLPIQLFQNKKGLTFNSKTMNATFSLFEYDDDNQEHEWFLIANSSKKENQRTTSEIQLETETKSYLIPERNVIDYFLKINGELAPHFISKTVNQIKKIEQIITSYIVDKNSLKSKDFLTF